MSDDLDWDSLSSTPPVPAAPSDSADPVADSVIAQMNTAAQAGASDDEVISQAVGNFGRKGRAAKGDVSPDETAAPKSLKWDDLSDAKPAASELNPQYQPQRDYAGTVLNSPVSRDVAPDAGGGDVPTAPSALQNQAIASDAAQVPPADNRREVGFAEAAKRFADARATDASGVIAGAATFLGYPVNALDAAISGRKVPSIAEAVSQAEEPYKSRSEQDQLKPAEKLGLAGELGAGAGQLAIDLPTMAVSGPARAAEATGEGLSALATSIAQKVTTAAQVSTVPATLNAKEAAEQVLNNGGTPEDAANAAAKAIATTVGSNAVPMGAAGNLPKRIATGGAVGALLSGSDDPSQIEAGAITGAVMAGVHGERGAPPETAAQKAARRVAESTDQLIANNPAEVQNANEIPQDQRGVPGQGTQPESSGEGSGENIQQRAETGAGAGDAGVEVAPTAAKPTEDTTNVDQNVQPTGASGAATEEAPAKAAFTPDERHTERVETLLNDTPGLTNEQKARIRAGMPPPAKDPLTGYDLRPELAPTIDAAIKDGKPAAYVEMDIKKLHALNGFSGSEEAADVHMKAMTDMTRKALEDAGGTVTPFKKGGDEFGYVVQGIDGATAHDAMAQASAKVDDYVRANGLDAMHNDRTGEDETTGVHFAATDIKPSDTTHHVMRATDELVTARKRGFGYERPGTTETTGTDRDTGVGHPASVATHDVENAGGEGNAGDIVRPAQDLPTYRQAAFTGLHDEIGWDQHGGRLLRAASDQDQEYAARANEGSRFYEHGINHENIADKGPVRGTGDVIGRTTWEPKMRSDGNGPSGFWRNYRAREGSNALNEKQAHEALNKAQNGEKLTTREHRFVNHAHDTVEEYAQEYREAHLAHDLQSRHEGEPVYSRQEKTRIVGNDEKLIGDEEPMDTVPHGTILWHGTPGEMRPVSKDDILHLTTQSAEARAYAKNEIPGTSLGASTKGGSRIHAFESNEESKVKDVNSKISDALENGDVGQTVKEELKQARDEGYGFIRYEHPSGVDGTSMQVYIPTHPEQLNKHARNYRRGDAAEPGVTEPEARAALPKEVGAKSVATMEAAGLKIAPSSELAKLAPELSPAQRQGVKGVTSRAGQPHLIHDQTPAAEIPATVVHEVWHANEDRVLPKSKQAELAAAVDRVATRNPKVAEALASIPKSTPKYQLAKEKVAYALQSVHTGGIATKALDAIKIGLNKLGVPKNWLDANEALLRRIGSENLKHFAESGPRTYQTAEGRTATPKPRVRVPVDMVPTSRTAEPAARTAEPVARTTEPATAPPRAAEPATPSPASEPAASPSRVTSIKNAQVNTEREERGAEILHSVKGASNQEAMAKAGEQLQKDPDLGRRLTAELLKTPRPLSKTEVAVMLRDRIRIHNELREAYDAADGNPNDPRMVARIKDLEVQRDANDEADRAAGTENSLGLSARRMMADQDYTLVNMVKRLQVASGKKDLPAPVMQKVRELDKQMRAEQANRPEVAKRADDSPKAIKDEFEALRSELAAISKKPSSQPSGSRYARAEPNVAHIIQRMAANRAAAGVPEATALHEIHEAVAPHADVSLNDVRDAINAPKNVRRQAFGERKSADLKRRIKEGDFSKGTRYKPVYDETTLASEGRMNALQRQFDYLKRQEEMKNQSRAMKVGSTIHSTHLASILSSIKVYPKLAAAVIGRYGGHALEQATGAIAQHIPYVRRAFDAAPSQKVTLAGEGQYLRGIGRSFKNAKDQLLRGYSDIDAKYGGRDTITDEYTDYAGSLYGGVGDAIREGRYLDAVRGIAGGTARAIGRTHGTIKEFASTPKFYESYSNIASHMVKELRNQGLSEDQIQDYMSRKSTDMLIGTKAYLNGLEDKMQGKNALADGINSMLVRWDTSDNAGLKALSLAFQTAFPIRKIPMNIAKEVTSYTGGGIKALAAATKELTPERADYIAKNIKKQGAGAMIMAMGYLAGKPAVDWAEEEMSGAFHSAAGALFKMGADYRKAYESYYGKSHEAVDAGLHAFGDVFGAEMVQDIPYLNQANRWMKTAKWAPRDGRNAMSEIAGNTARSMIVPGFVQQYARANDSYKGFRKPKNILQDIELGIPGLRENVPTH